MSNTSANAGMHLSSAGRAALAQREGIRAHVYNDQGNNCTVGAGTLLHYGPCTAADRAAPPLNVTQIQQRMSTGITHAERQVRSTVRNHALTQAQFDAAVSFVYNTGRADALAAANQGNMINVATRMRAYVHVCRHDPNTGRVIHGSCRVSQGLVHRRAQETAPFQRATP